MTGQIFYTILQQTENVKHCQISFVIIAYLQFTEIGKITDKKLFSLFL